MLTDLEVVLFLLIVTVLLPFLKLEAVLYCTSYPVVCVACFFQVTLKPFLAAVTLDTLVPLGLMVKVLRIEPLYRFLNFTVTVYCPTFLRPPE